MPVFNKHSNKVSKLTDKAAEWIITIAGVMVIAAMAAMLVLIAREAAPLFFPASEEKAGEIALPNNVDPLDVVGLGVDADLRDNVRSAAAILRDGRGGFASIENGEYKPFSFSRLPGAPDSASILSVREVDNGKLSVLWSDGLAALYLMSMDFPVGQDGRSRGEHAFRVLFNAGFEISPESGEPLCALLRGDEKKYRAVLVYKNGTVTENRLSPGKGLAGRKKSVASTRTFRIEQGGEILSAALNDDGILYLGTKEGNILSVDLSGDTKEDARWDITPVYREQLPVSGLTFLNGGYALAVGGGDGNVSVWFPRREGGAFRLRRAGNWDGAGNAVTVFAVSGRDRGFFALDESGAVRWLYSTTGADLLDIPPLKRSRAAAIAVNARTDNLVTLAQDGTVHFYRMNSSYPEAGKAGFFQKLLYEGYDEPAFVWQSTGADSSEPKLSLVPLIWGSVKAALYAMAFATPIALAAAMYLSQFAAPVWRARLKPTVEMVAAVPSVVIGFLAALWLAPLLERHLGYFTQHFSYDQRNALVIAIAMGFAVIPTVFSLAEDAISAVPPSLSAASLALGASKWQTVMRVVLPTASPGIFTAVMLGFGRAVGETMIVLMAAGNTPIMSLSPFNGMRTLSANIAVEMPEAPVGGTLYRTLFLCSLILFVMTLVINTAAEIFRHRLRRRYGRI